MVRERKKREGHRINAFGEKLTTVKGRYSRTEDDIILKALAVGLKKRRMLPSDIGTGIKYDGLFQSIAEELPHRSVEGVYERAKKLINPLTTGPWTHEENKELCQLVDSGTKWKTIEYKLGRSAIHCRYQFRRLNEIDWDPITQQPSSGQPFSKDEIELLRTELIRIMEIPNKDANFLEISKQINEKKDCSIPWSALCRKFPRRDNATILWKYKDLVKRDAQMMEQPTQPEKPAPKQLFPHIQTKHCLDVMIIAAELSKQPQVQLNTFKLSKINAQWPKTRKECQMDKYIAMNSEEEPTPSSDHEKRKLKQKKNKKKKKKRKPS